MRMKAQSGDGQDRRKDLRIDVSFPINIVLTATGQRQPAVVENISLSGVLLRSEGELPLKTQVELEIQPSERPGLRIPATVVRAAGTQIYGTVFAELSESDADKLMKLTADYLNAAAPAPWFLG
jgi:hypothetical protein